MAANEMEEIKKLFADRIGVASIDEGKSLQDLGLDSLDVVEMCLDLEDKYQIHFESEELAEFKTIGDLFKSIEKKLAAR